MLTNRRAREDGNSNREMQGSRGRWPELWWVKRERPIKGRSQCKEYLSFTLTLGPYCLLSFLPSQSLTLSSLSLLKRTLFLVYIVQAFKDWIVQGFCCYHGTTRKSSPIQGFPQQESVCLWRNEDGNCAFPLGMALG